MRKVSKDIGRCWRVWDRTRVQYFISENVNVWQVRNCARVYLKIKCLQPFLGNECFFLERIGFSENRTYIGALLLLGKRLKCTPCYMIRFVKIEKWRDTRVFMTYLSLEF